MQTENWKDVPNYEGYYQVSNLGRMKSFNLNKETILTKPNYNHYSTIILCKNKIRKSFRIHRLVAICFLPNPENKPQVNHIDGNKCNNTVVNLEWVTSQENQIHKINVLGYKHSDLTKQKIAKNNFNSKKVKCFQTNKIWESVKQCSIELGFNHFELLRILNNSNKNNTTLNYIN